ncbi:hypothetical protein RB195_013187 [Necator americanus]|uniref:Uncharacterized protein n=1 Tax=Necator americanus TaxID=51031 RepID=A0ABR1DVK5_NECAM
MTQPVIVRDTKDCLPKQSAIAWVQLVDRSPTTTFVRPAHRYLYPYTHPQTGFHIGIRLDRVVFQIETLSGQINVLSYKIDGAVTQIKEHGQQTISSISNNFNKDTIENVNRMLRIIKEKTHDWPVTALIVVGVTAFVLILVTFLFLITKGGEKIVEKKYKKKALIADHDIENL